MSIGTNISVITVGAILTFATRIHASGISVQAVGAVLMVVGAVSLALQIGSLAGQRRSSRYVGSTAEALRPGESPYQSAGEYNGSEW
jgi:hypothetical protein